MKRLLACFLAASLLFAVPLASSDRIKTVMPLQDESGNIICTVFSINEKDKLWATALHCLDYIPHIDGSLMRIVKQGADEFYEDVAILKGPIGASELRLAEHAPEVFDSVAFAGFPQPSTEPVYFYGWLMARLVPTRTRFISDSVAVVLESRLPGPGVSGSPVVNVSGELIGLVWGGADGTTNSWIVPYEIIKRVIGPYQKNLK